MTQKEINSQPQDQSAYETARFQQLIQRVIEMNQTPGKLWQQLKMWLYERQALLSAFIRQYFTPTRLSRSEWLALVMASGLMVSSLAQPLMALAQEPVGSEFQVNSYTTSDQESSRIAINGDGDFVITWESTNQNGSDLDIYAQRYDADGIPQGSEFQVNTYTTNSQELPGIAMDDMGNFVIVWNSSDQDESSYGIYGQRYSASGLPQGSEFQVNSHTSDTQRFADVAMNSDGDFVVTWQSGSLFGGNQDGSGYGIYAQRYNASGVAQGGEFQVNSYVADSQRKPNVAINGDGDFVITWASTNQDGSNYGIYAQRYNANGTPQGSEFQVNSHTTDWQHLPSVALNADGDFIVAWESYDDQDGSGFGIYAQRYDADGIPQDSEFQVNSYTTDWQVLAQVSVDSAGDFIIIWESREQDGSRWSVHGQRYNDDGVPQGSEFQINTYTTGSQRGASLGMNATGDFVVTWHSFDQDGSQWGVFAQRYSQASQKIYLPLIQKTVSSNEITTVISE